MCSGQKSNSQKNKQYFGPANRNEASTPHINLLRISSLLAGERHEPLEVALIAAHAKESVFEATAFEIRFKFSMDMSWQTFALKFQLLNQVGVVFLYKLVEQGLLWAMAFIGGVTKGMPIYRGSPPLCLVTACCVDSNRVEVKHSGVVSFDGEHPKYATAWIYSSRSGHTYRLWSMSLHP